MKRTELINYAALGRLRISFASALSAMVSYILASFHPGPGMFVTGMGVFLLSCGASALNQCQEKDTDALMERTRKRPLPSGRLSAGRALYFSAVCSAAGLGLIFMSGGTAAAAAGLFALAWYNGLYTSLKRRTPVAAVPGALVGTVPPVIGWHSAGGNLSDPGLFALCLFFFLWQVPHFWLYAASLAEDYGRAGLPAVTSVFSERQLARIVFIWIAASAVGALLFVPYGLTLHLPAGYLLAAASFLLILQGSGILKKKEGDAAYRRALAGINIYLISVMLLLFTDRII